MKNQENSFWNWFIQNKTRYENILLNINDANEDELDEAMSLIEEELHKIDENLWFRMGNQNPFDLIITAEGDTEYFDMVQQLVEEAPEIENWNIIAFIQPQDIAGFNYKMDNFELTDNDIWFSYDEVTDEDGSFLETMFYVTDEKYIEDDEFLSSIIRIAEASVGEYDFAEFVGFLDVVEKSEVFEEHTSGLLPITQFHEVVNSFKSKQ